MVISNLVETEHVLEFAELKQERQSFTYKSFHRNPAQVQC